MENQCQKIANNSEKVTSVGNSWVICRSKSHIGRIYYFNTLTGEAAWNLSDADIEKAKKTTMFLREQPGSRLDSCPEPKDSPTIMKNPYKAFNISPSFINQNMNHNQLQDQPFTLTLGVTPTPYNSDVWAIPPNHEVLMSPPKQIRNPNSNLNFGFKEDKGHKDLAQNSNFSAPGRVNPNHNAHIYNSSNNTRSNYSFNEFRTRNGNNFNQNKSSVSNKFNKSVNSYDLRQVLSKRSSSWNNETGTGYQSTSQKEEAPINTQHNSKPKIQIIKPSVEFIPRDVDDTWLKSHASLEGTQLKLNVLPLKEIVLIDKNIDCWYVVADFNGLFEHFNLINVLVNSDDHCFLMIPEVIMSKLHEASKSDNTVMMNQAHIVLRLLTQQFTSGRAVIGKEPLQEKSLDIYEFCLKLYTQYKNVVLISNGTDIHYKRRYSSLHVFNVFQLKEILTAKCLPAKSNVLPLSNNAGIKVKISSCSFDSYTRSPEILVSKEIHNNSKSNINTVTTKKPIVFDGSEKNTLDMAVQTDLITDVGRSLSKNDISRHNIVDLNKNNKDQEKNTTELNVPNVNAVVPKKREIRLKRNAPQQLTESTKMNSERKQFKWRKKITNEPSQIVKAKSETKNTGSDFDNGIVKKFDSNDKACEVNFYQESCNSRTNHDVANDIGSENTIISCVPQNAEHNNLIIRDTSTSGIASNSNNNISESTCSNRKGSNLSVNYERNDNSMKCVMFEVESPAMEEWLKKRSDEWVSRFLQIMEEILSIVLQQEPSFVDANMPPPWSLHEATECIKKKFYNDDDVIDAANKLTHKLYNNSNDTGKIDMNIKPTAFMEIYSYGVYLIDSLQYCLSNSEDLRIASDSLAKLLIDIEDPSTYSIHNDSFNDNIEDISAEITMTSSSISTHKESACAPVNQGHKNDIDKVCGKSQLENHRSTRKKSLEQNVAANESEDQNEIVRSPKIIRNFSKCTEFEQRLNSNKRETLDLDSLDYSDLHDGDEDVDGDDDNYYEEVYNSKSNFYQNDDLEMETVEKNIEIESQSTKIPNVHKQDFRWIVGKIMIEIRDVFMKVHEFCTNTHQELDVTKEVCIPRKMQILEQAKEARTHMENLYKSLNSILYREDIGNKVELILKDTGTQINSEQSTEYRNMIYQCLKQADILLDSVNLVVEAVK